MKVLLTGSTGYIGRRLKKTLLNYPDLQLKLLVRNKKSLSSDALRHCEVIEGDTFNLEALTKALTGVETAYYLVHSLSSSNYKELDKDSAQNFVDIAQMCGVKRIIYLGGLGVKDENTSEHLLSRIETGEVLSSNKNIQTLWIRAGVIIGSGSASFEIIRNLTEKLPIMTTPTWVSTKAQPIAVDDVLAYLYESLRLKESQSTVIDIGSEQLSYKDMMHKTAKSLGLKRYIIKVPFLSIGLSSYWLNIFTPIPFKVAKSLIEGLKSEVIIQNDNATKYFPQILPLSYNEAVAKAVEEIKEDQIMSRWDDNGGTIWEKDHNNAINDAIYVDRKTIDISGISHQRVYQSFTSVGGEYGWFDYDYLWKLRGVMDKALGGVGLRRGRKRQSELRTGDSLDFWKVVDIKNNERLLLYAQMILPGEAWLEFKIQNDQLIQSAYFYPKGVLGRLYWFTLIPLHYFVFNNMIKCIIENAKNKFD